ncbi:hypothetical protein TrLO_g14009 [Triparma laevis f. longispina]|uniref:Prolyl 4-hydroxylase alpha subunit domain-containing protein n=1 Tax=Triparma laevis f. longispina TaxID=1714387 RepID=A0A9W6ZDS0_9STRA|nr:hypothetical protein TrLO_g14009 [Triparma laevis f. longispina]
MSSLSILLTFLLLNILLVVGEGKKIRSLGKEGDGTRKKQNVNDLEYTVFPKRQNTEAAVLEWGHSAIINAIDAVSSSFGVQPTSGAFFEVEASPVLGEPLDGEGGDFRNCEEVRGNIVVVTSGRVEFVELAGMARDCEAAALVVVLVPEDETNDTSADYIYPMSGSSNPTLASSIDFPCVMISLSSGNMLASAGEDGKGMPERVRLYSGGDRPYFEDVSQVGPMVYLIHNLLGGEEEGEHLIDLAKSKVSKYTGEPNYLEGTSETSPTKSSLSRGYLWKGKFLDSTISAIDERIQQVTGFPPEHLSDFQINMYESGGFESPHYDSMKSFYHEQSASILIFLTDGHEGGELIFPAADPPIKIKPKKGMGVVWHNSDENGQLDNLSVHGELRLTGDTSDVKYTVKKWVFAQPQSHTRSILLPILFIPFGGQAPEFVKNFYNFCLMKWGADTGYDRFHQAVTTILGLLIISIITVVGKTRELMEKKPEGKREKEKENGETKKKK